MLEGANITPCTERGQGQHGRSTAKNQANKRVTLSSLDRSLGTAQDMDAFGSGHAGSGELSRTNRVQVEHTASTGKENNVSIPENISSIPDLPSTSTGQQTSDRIVPSLSSSRKGTSAGSDVTTHTALMGINQRTSQQQQRSDRIVPSSLSSRKGIDARVISVDSNQCTSQQQRSDRTGPSLEGNGTVPGYGSAPEVERVSFYTQHHPGVEWTGVQCEGGVAEPCKQAIVPTFGRQGSAATNKLTKRSALSLSGCGKQIQPSPKKSRSTTANMAQCGVLEQTTPRANLLAQGLAHTQGLVTTAPKDALLGTPPVAQWQGTTGPILANNASVTCSSTGGVATDVATGIATSVAGVASGVAALPTASAFSPDDQQIPQHIMKKVWGSLPGIV